jgi:aryl-alcohol dehydrogenase-like predicted oxidoreductase
VAASTHSLDGRGNGRAGPPATLQPQYSLLSREIEWEIVPAAMHNGIGLLPWSPLAGGFLSGKYQRGGTPPPGTRAGSEKPLYQWVSEEYANCDRNWATIDAVVRIAKESGATPAQVALSWIADRPGVIAPIVGARTSEHLRNNLGAAELTLDDEATAVVDLYLNRRLRSQGVHDLNTVIYCT